MNNENETPNLDGMWEDDLQAFIKTSKGMLKRYAIYKLRAMQYRKAGNIPMAMDLERSCDIIYKQLPKSKKW